MRNRVFTIALMGSLLFCQPSPAGPDDFVTLAVRGAQYLCQRTAAIAGGAAHYFNPFKKDPLYVDTDTFRAISRRAVGSYFPNGYTPEAMAELTLDLQKMAANFERVNLKNGKLRNRDEVLAELTKALELMGRQDALENLEDRTLSSLFFDEHAERSKEQADRPRVMKRLAGKAFRIPVAVAAFTLGIVGQQLTWNLRMIGYETTDFVNTPIRNNISRVTNERLGWIGVTIQMSMSQLEQSVDIHNKMLAEVDKLDEVAAKANAGKKFQIDGLTLDETKKLWLDGEKAFLEYRKEMNAVLPDLVAVGRGYYKDANIINPLTFSTAVNTVKTLISQSEDRISTLEHRRRQDGNLTEKDDHLLRQAYIDLEMAKRQMGTTLALIRIHQIFYPEYVRPSWSNEPSENPFMNQYGPIVDGLGLEYFAKEYTTEMRLQLAALGLQLSGADLNAVARRQQEIANRLGGIAAQK